MELRLEYAYPQLHMVSLSEACPRRIGDRLLPSITENLERSPEPFSRSSLDMDRAQHLVKNSFGVLEVALRGCENHEFQAWRGAPSWPASRERSCVRIAHLHRLNPCCALLNILA
jgi:hypothetical protein